MGAHLGAEARYTTCEALTRHWARVAHEALHCLSIDGEAHLHLHLHHRTHLLQLQLGESWISQTKRLLLRDRWRR